MDPILSDPSYHDPKIIGAVHNKDAKNRNPLLQKLGLRIIWTQYWSH